MTATADFLVEIGTEELPPKSLADLERAFAEPGRRTDCAAPASASASLRSFATPRRLAVLVSGLQLEQPVQKIEKRGPPVAVAFDADGSPTRAAVAFAEGCGVPVEALGRMETPKGAWLFHSATAPGTPGRRAAARHRHGGPGRAADPPAHALGQRRRGVRPARRTGS